MADETDQTPVPGSPLDPLNRWLLLVVEIVGWGLLAELSVFLGNLAGGTLNSIIARTSWISFIIALLCRLVPVGIAGAVFSRTQRAPQAFERWKGVAVTVTMVAVIAVPWLVGIFKYPYRP